MNTAPRGGLASCFQLSLLCSPCPGGSPASQHGEQPGVRRASAAPQVVRGMRGEDRRPLPALLHGALLAHPLPQVLLLPSPAGGHWHHLLQQRGHDSVSERLHQVRGRKEGRVGGGGGGGEEAAGFGIWRLPHRLSNGCSVFVVCLQTVRAQRGVQRLWPVDSSQRDGNEGAGKCLPPQGKSPSAHVNTLFVSRCLFDRDLLRYGGGGGQREGKTCPLSVGKERKNCALHLFLSCADT